jgi:hypothetical protein
MDGRKKITRLLIVSITLSAGCTTVATAVETGTIPDMAAANLTTVATAVETGTIPGIATASRTPSPTPTATLTASPTPLPTLPLPEYPDITLPGIDRLREIFLSGQREGMRSGVFAKVGDSITANNVFLAPFGSGDYSLGEYGYLQEMIDFYSRENAREGNSFADNSIAAHGSWRAEHVLDPSKAPSPCAAGEVPLTCEYRLVQPAVAVILLGTNDVMAPTKGFETSYPRILAETLDRGIIPILNTLPPMRGQDVEPFNAVIRFAADQWDVPWIDLYSALVRLPGQGLSRDGIHLSWIEPAVFEPRYLEQGMTVRNLLTLQALDAVWRSYSTLATT